MKRLAAIAVLILVIAITGNPQNGPEHQNSHTQNPSPPPVETVGKPAPQTETNCPAQKPPEPHSGIEWATWTLALVGCGGIWVAVKTLKAIKKQADIANRTLIAQFRPS